MTPPATEAVLFDAAGTLIHPSEPIGETYARAAGRQGAEISAWRIQDAFGRVFRSAPPMVFPDLAPDDVPARERAWWFDVVRSTFLAADSAVRPADFDALFEELWSHFAEPASWQLAPGVEPALEALRRAGLRLAVASNFDARLVALLEGKGLARHLDAVVLPLHAGACKPDPRFFAHALEAVGCPAERAVYVGDDPALDLEGARAAGLRAIDATGLATLAELPARIEELAE